MRWARTLQLVAVHCEGEIGKVVTGGLIGLPGASMLDKLDHLNRVDDSLRRFLVFEPRGCAQMSVNLLLAPSVPEADAGFIVLQADQAHAMSGSNAICVATALLETGMVAMTEPVTDLVLDTAAGLVRVRASCRDGRCERVDLEMPDAFVFDLDVTAEVEGWGEVTADIAFGGVFYALVDAEPLGLEIVPEQARALVEAGVAVNRAFNAALPVRHPERPGIEGIAYVMFRGRDPDGALRTCTTVKPGRVDRSPCGTGTSANLAVMHARGDIGLGEPIVSRSIIGSEFRAELLRASEVAGRPAVVPRIGGRGWIYGIEQIGLDPSDPFPAGFALSDTWGPAIEPFSRRSRA